MGMFGLFWINSKLVLMPLDPRDHLVRVITGAF